MQTIHQSMMHLYRDGHLHSVAFFAVLAEHDFRNRIKASPVSCVREAGERDPGDDGVVYEIVTVGAFVQSGCSSPRALNRRLGASMKAIEVVFIVEVDEGEAIVGEQQCRARMNAFVDEHALAAQPVTKRLNLVGCLHRKKVVGDEERQALHVRQAEQWRDINIGADIEERIVEVLEEIELLATVPILSI